MGRTPLGEFSVENVLVEGRREEDEAEDGGRKRGA